jgi:hypothetical protein
MSIPMHQHVWHGFGRHQQALQIQPFRAVNRTGLSLFVFGFAVPLDEG